jgi:hypothetical protein
MIVLSSYSLSIYIPTAQACPSSQNNKSLLLLLFSTLLQHEPSYLSDVAEIQDIAEALTLQRSSLLKFFFFQNYLPLLSNRPLYLMPDLPPYYLFYLLHSVLFSTLPKNFLSPSNRLLILHP